MKLQTYTGGIASTNAYLLEHGTARILIDAPEGAADWLQSTLPDQPLSAILITHQHFDHLHDLGAIQAIQTSQAQQDCPTYSMEAPSSELTLSEMYALITGKPFHVPAYAIDQHCKGGDTLHIAGLDIAIHHTPGHSPDSLSFEIQDLELLFSGDVLMKQSIGRSDFPHSNPEALNESLKKLAGLKPETKVYPGHGPSTSIGVEVRENPWLLELL